MYCSFMDILKLVYYLIAYSAIQMQRLIEQNYYRWGYDLRFNAMRAREWKGSRNYIFIHHILWDCPFLVAWLKDWLSHVHECVCGFWTIFTDTFCVHMKPVRSINANIHRHMVMHVSKSCIWFLGNMVPW